MQYFYTDGIILRLYFVPYFILTFDALSSRHWPLIKVHSTEGPPPKSTDHKRCQQFFLWAETQTWIQFSGVVYIIPCYMNIRTHVSLTWAKSFSLCSCTGGDSCRIRDRNRKAFEGLPQTTPPRVKSLESSKSSSSSPEGRVKRTFRRNSDFYS